MNAKILFCSHEDALEASESAYVTIELPGCG